MKHSLAYSQGIKYECNAVNMNNINIDTRIFEKSTEYNGKMNNCFSPDQKISYFREILLLNGSQCTST